MHHDLARAFADHKGSAVITAAAGCGKTDLIARAVGLNESRRQLVLTHTHAGVRVLRERFKKYNVPAFRFRLETIDGWCLQYVLAYPHLAQLAIANLNEIDWPSVHQAADRLLARRAVRGVVAMSYAGIYVDEYQDCSPAQHSLIMRLAEFLPCRIVGDPLQGIFDFRNQQIVDWSRDIGPHFEKLGELTEPHRWKLHNPHLGKWLATVRTSLLNHEAVDLRTSLPRASLEWCQLLGTDQDERAQLNKCREKAGKSDEKVVVLCSWERACQSFAKKLQGMYTCMETVECGELRQYCARIESNSGTGRAAAVLDFAGACMCRGRGELSFLDNWIRRGGKQPRCRIGPRQHLVDALAAVISTGTPHATLAALGRVEQIAGNAFYRRELWRDMQRTLRNHDPSSGVPIEDTARGVRDSGRRMGRPRPRLTVSRPLLVKGLEFEHVVILDAGELQTDKLFYVAITRASKSVTVFSKNPIVDCLAGDGKQKCSAPQTNEQLNLF